MTNKTENTRELITDMVTEITAGREKSHILIRNVLDKYNYLPEYDRSFIKKVTEATSGRAEIEEEGELWFADNDGEVLLFEE